MIASMTDWTALMPALIVVATALIVVGADLFLRGSRGALVALAMGGLAASAGLLVNHLRTAAPALHAFGNALVLDDLAALLSLAVLAATALLMVSAEVDTRRRRIAFGEYYGLVLLAAAAMLMLVASNDFLMIFINLEILSLSLYVLTGITRRNPRSNEAAMKYLITGAFATGFLLMGVAFVFGATGSIQLGEIGRAVTANPHAPLLSVGFGLLLVGFGFKIGAVPFHMWVPDVYDGAPTSTTAFMSVTVKVAAVGALIRMLLVAGVGQVAIWADLLWWAAVATMVFGNLVALQQRSVKRMLAYSSIAHTGYVLVALATLRATDGTFSTDGAASALVFLCTYVTMTFGAFMVLVYLGHEVPVAGPGGAAHPPEWQDAEDIDDLAGMGERHPWAALAMTVFLVSLGGIPPTAGFFGKFAVFAAAVDQGHVVIAVIGVSMSLVSLYYYLRVVVALYMREAVSTDESPDRSVGLVVVLAAVGTVLLGVLPATLWDWAARAIAHLAG